MKLCRLFILLALMVNVIGCGNSGSRSVHDGADQAEIDAYRELQRIKASEE